MVLFYCVQFFAKVVNMTVISKINNVVNFGNVNNFEKNNSISKTNVQAQNFSGTQEYTKVPVETYKAYFNILKEETKNNKPLITKLLTGNGNDNDICPSPKDISKLYDAFKNLLEQSKDENFWTNLPKKILKTGMIDKVYDTVDKFKAPFGKDAKLIFVALGNPANADEAAKALGLGSNITYCCATSPHEIKNAINNAGGNLDKIQVMISSKSGSTFESNETYKFLLNEFENHYKQKGLSDEETKQEVAKHFLCLTDKNPSAKLKKEAIERGYATVDCIDNLASGFGDLAYDMPLLAYAGLKKDEMVKMVKTSENWNNYLLKSSDEKIPFIDKLLNKNGLDNVKKACFILINSNNLADNDAIKLALFDHEAAKEGAKKEQFIFHDTTLDLSSTIAQLYRESLRKVNLELNTYPRCAHSGLQSAIDRTLSNQPINNITNISTFGKDKPDSAYQLEAAHITNAANEGHWQKLIQLKLDDKRNGVTPEALAAYLTLKSHVAYYKNQFENDGALDIYKMPYVNGYKKIREELVATDKKD